ncbi:hypothetical protein Ancab_031524 [Ancistrocladus abbreviatus]
MSFCGWFDTEFTEGLKSLAIWGLKSPLTHTINATTNRKRDSPLPLCYSNNTTFIHSIIFSSTSLSLSVLSFRQINKHLMGKKMKLPFLSKTLSDTKPSPSPWQWPTCGHIKTLSFREASGSAAAQDNIFKTVNSAYLIDMTVAAETPHSRFTNSSAESSGSFSTMSEESGSDQIEMVIRGLRSERLFFEPGESNSILAEANKISISSGTCNRTITSSRRRRSKSFGGGNNLVPYNESVVLSMESKDPFVDFRRSMEEMIEAHGLKDWESLEELLAWFLRANGKNNHGYIIGAFVDLLVSLSSATFVSTSSSSTQSAAISTPTAAAAAATSSTSFSSSTISPSSPLSLPSSSSLTTPCVSSLDQGGDDDDDDDENSNILSS